MICSEVRATKMVAILLALGIKSAEAMSKEEACRLYSRTTRGVRSTGKPMSPFELGRVGRQKRRARNTHRGKR